MSVLDKGRLTTAAVTVAIAVGAGHVMQYGFSGGTFATEDEAQPAPRPSRPSRPSAQSADAPIYSPLLPAPTPMPETPEEALASPTLPKVASIAVPAEAIGQLAAGGLECRADASLTVLPDAVMRVDVRACGSDVPVHLTYAGLMITEQADAHGRLNFDLPALGPTAELLLEIDGHAPIALSASVPDAVWNDRVAVVWDGAASVSVRSQDDGALEESQTLGDADLQTYVTEIHTLSSQRDAPAVSIVAEATAASCGREFPLRILRSSADNGPQDTTISVAFPPCDALGEFVVLKNLSEDLTVAHN